MKFNHIMFENAHFYNNPNTSKDHFWQRLAEIIPEFVYIFKPSKKTEYFDEKSQNHEISSDSKIVKRIYSYSLIFFISL